MGKKNIEKLKAVYLNMNLGSIVLCAISWIPLIWNRQTVGGIWLGIYIGLLAIGIYNFCEYQIFFFAISSLEHPKQGGFLKQSVISRVSY